MRFSIVAEDKPAQKSFSYQLELDTDTIIKVTGLVCSTVVMVTLLSLFKRLDQNLYFKKEIEVLSFITASKCFH